MGRERKFTEDVKTLPLASTTFAKNVNPLSVPTATVKLSIIRKAIRAMPARKPAVRITAQTNSQL